MVQSLIFDMDGTIFQTDKILEISLEDAFNHLRSLNEWDKETPIDKYREIMGVPLPKVWYYQWSSSRRSPLRYKCR